MMFSLLFILPFSVASVLASRSAPVTVANGFFSAEDIRHIFASVDIRTLEPRSTTFDDGTISLNRDGYQARASFPRSLVDPIFGDRNHTIEESGERLFC